MAVQEFHKDVRTHLRLLAREASAALSEAEADALYLRLDTTNDPLTGDLEIQGIVEQSRIGAAANAIWRSDVDSGVHTDIQHRVASVLSTIIRISDSGRVEIQDRLPSSRTYLVFERDEVIYNALENIPSAFSIGERSTLRGDTQDAHLNFYGEQAGVIRRFLAANTGSNMQFADVTGGLNVQWLGDGAWNHEFRDGSNLVVFDSDDSHDITVRHDGTQGVIDTGNGGGDLQLSPLTDIVRLDALRIAAKFDSFAGIGVSQMQLGQSGTDVITFVRAGDTRTRVFDPADYNNSFCLEFKQASVLNDAAVLGSETYGGLMTIAPWADSSGGSKFQNYYRPNAIWYRSQPGSSAAWDTDGRGRWTQHRLGHQYDNGSIEFQEYFPAPTSHLSSDSSSITGAIKIELPVNLGSNVMLYVEVEGWDYDSAWINGGEQGGGPWKVAIGGYTFSTGWVNNHAHVVYGNPKFRRIRFYDDGSNVGFFLGETTDVNEHPKVIVSKVVVTFADPSEHDWAGGISTTITTSVAGLTFDSVEAYIHKLHSANGSFAPSGRIYPQVASDITPQLVGYIDAPTQRGSINVDGQAAGSYAGYSIGNEMIYMFNGAAGGLYDEVNNHWRFRADDNTDHIVLYNDTVEEARTKDSNATGASAGLEVKKHDQEWVDVGYNTMTRERTNVSFSPRAEEAGGIAYYNNSTAYTITLDSNADFPANSRFEVQSTGTGVKSFNASGTTIRFFGAGGAVTTGNFTMTTGWITCHKFNASNWFCTGTK